MRIAVDGRSLLAGRGVARFARAVLAELPGVAGGDEVVVVVPGRAPLRRPAPPGVEVVRTPAPSRLTHGAAALCRRPRLDRLAGGADAVWLPAPAPVAVSRGVPVVLTLHDRSWELRPRDFTAYERMWHRLARPRALAARAAGVTAVSEWVRADAVAAWGLEPARVRVVRPGPGLPAPLEAPPSGPPGARPYLLAVGALEPRKAPEVLARAYVLARGRGVDADLAVAGDGRGGSALRATDGVRVLGSVSDPVLDGLYAGALALVHPALLEGFGLPLVEAAVRGLPIVASDLPALRETLGDAALFTPPGDAVALADGIVRLAGDGALRAELGAAARRRARELSWTQTARELHRALREAAA